MMPTSKPIIGIPGLGADYRVFQHLSIYPKMQIIEWIAPVSGETIQDYSKRLTAQIESKEPIVLVAVSFGGLIAKEFVRLLTVKHTFLISSVAQPAEISSLYRIVGRLGIFSKIPTKWLMPPIGILQYLFGTDKKHRSLLRSIIRDTSPEFVQWAIPVLLTWRNEDPWISYTRIHGDRDRMLSCPRNGVDYRILGGHHFMIVDRAGEINPILEEELYRNAVSET